MASAARVRVLATHLKPHTCSASTNVQQLVDALNSDSRDARLAAAKEISAWEWLGTETEESEQVIADGNEELKLLRPLFNMVQMEGTQEETIAACSAFCLVLENS